MIINNDLVINSKNRTLGNICDTLDYGVKGTILWTNPDTTVDFGAQQITLSDNYSNYDFIDFLYKRTKGNNMRYVARCKGGDGGLYVTAYDAERYKCQVRSYSFTGNNKVDISDSSIYNVTVNNAYLIPVAVVGYKTKLFTS